MSTSKGSVADLDGRRMPVYRPALMGVRRDDADTFPEREFQELRRRLRRASPMGCFNYEAGAWLLVSVWGVRIVAGLLRRDPAHLQATRWLLLIALLTFAYLVHTRLLPIDRKHAEQIASTLRSMGRCPSCASDLSGLPRGPDSSVRCGECGARWQSPDRTPAGG